MLENNHATPWRRPDLRLALLLMLAFSATGDVYAQSGHNPLTLENAAQLSLRHHPQLHVFEWRTRALEGQRLTADRAPAYEIGLEAENVLGSGDFSGVDAAEITLALSSVIELGGKRQARKAAVDSRFALVIAEKKAAALDLLGEVTQNFIATLSLQEKLKLAADATDLAQTTFQQVRARARQGAVPEAEVLRAKAALANARLDEAELASRYESNKVVLASYWGTHHRTFSTLSGDLFAFKAVESFEALYQRVEATPAIELYASEERVREAELQLVRSQSDSDIWWQVGVKRFEASGDNAFTLGFSMPLFTERRNRGDMQAAIAAKKKVSVQKQAALLALRARLFKAYTARQQQFEAVKHLREDILPPLSEALTHTRKAYEKGRYRYVDWVSAQQELLDARMALIEAATTVLLNQTLIEQLTAQPLENR